MDDGKCVDFKVIPLNQQYCPACGCRLVIEIRKLIVVSSFAPLGGIRATKTKKDYVCPRCRLLFLPNKKTGLVGVMYPKTK